MDCSVNHVEKSSMVDIKTAPCKKKSKVEELCSHRGNFGALVICILALNLKFDLI